MSLGPGPGINRARRVKTVDAMKIMSDDDCDIFCPNWIDNYYPTRPLEYENWSLYEFSAQFDIVYCEPKRETTIYYKVGNKKFIRQRNSPCLINHYRINLKQQPDAYYFSLLLLFKPWRNLDDLKCGKKNYIEAFESCQNELNEAMEYHNRLEEFRNAHEQIETELKEIEEKEADAAVTDLDDEQILDFEQPHDELRMMNNLVQNDNSIPLNELIAQLNPNQLRIFNEVIDVVRSYSQEFENASNDKLKNPRLAPKKILRKFVSGVGGTGKSRLINVVRKYILEELDKEVAVVAPTGIAAFNVNGLTIHRLLNLPVEKDGVCPYKKLRDDTLHRLRHDMKNTVILIIDEISMVSIVMFIMIHLRLCEIYGTLDELDGWFGRINILVFGDLLQLSPVNESFIFENLSREKATKYFNSLNFEKFNIWKELFY